MNAVGFLRQFVLSLVPATQPGDSDQHQTTLQFIKHALTIGLLTNAGGLSGICFLPQLGTSFPAWTPPTVWKLATFPRPMCSHPGLRRLLRIAILLCTMAAWPYLWNFGGLWVAIASLGLVLTKGWSTMAVQNHELELLEGRYLLILFGLIVSSLLYHSCGAMKSSETPNVSPPMKGGCRSLRPWWVICLVVLLMTPGLGAVQCLGTASRSASITHTPQPQTGVTQPWNLPRESLSNLDPTRYTAWLGTRVVRPDDDADHCQFVNPDIFYVPQRRGGMPKPFDNGDDDDPMSPSLRQERHAKTHQMSTRSTKAARPDPSVTRQLVQTSTEKPPASIRLVYEFGKIVGED